MHLKKIFGEGCESRHHRLSERKIVLANCPSLRSVSLQGMDHNPGLTDAEDVALYLSRDLHKRKDRKAPPPYEIIRDEVVGRG